MKVFITQVNHELQAYSYCFLPFSLPWPLLLLKLPNMMPEKVNSFLRLDGRGLVSKENMNFLVMYFFFGIY